MGFEVDLEVEVAMGEDGRILMTSEGRGKLGVCAGKIISRRFGFMTQCPLKRYPNPRLQQRVSDPGKYSSKKHSLVSFFPCKTRPPMPFFPKAQDDRRTNHRRFYVRVSPSSAPLHPVNASRTNHLIRKSELLSHHLPRSSFVCLHLVGPTLSLHYR